MVDLSEEMQYDTAHYFLDPFCDSFPGCVISRYSIIEVQEGSESPSADLHP